MTIRRRTVAPLGGRDTYHVLNSAGELVVKGAAPHALNVAQRLAEQATEPGTLLVTRKSLFGPSVTLYRVDRVENGSVYTTAVSPED